MTVNESPGVNNFHISNRFFYIALMAIAASSFILMAVSGARVGFWLDEFATIESTGAYTVRFWEWIKSLPETIGINVSYIAMRIWFEIVRGSDVGALLLTEFLVAASSVFVGLIGRCVKDARAGILASIFFVFSYTVFEVAHEYRFYPFLVFFTAAEAYFYVKTVVDKTAATRYFVLFGLSMGLAVNSQFLACFLPMVLFIVDIFLYKTGRKNRRWMISYLIALPFAVCAAIPILRTYYQNDAFFKLAPIMEATVRNIVQMPRMLLDYVDIMVFLYCVALAFSILIIIRHFGRKPVYAFDTEGQSLAFLSLTVPVPISVLLGYIFGNLTESNSFALRYEQYLLPVIYVPMAIVALIAIDRVKVLGKQGFLVLALSSALFLAPQTAIRSYEYPLNMGVKPQVEWLYGNKALFDDNTTIVFYRIYNDTLLNVLKEMYFEEHDDWEIPISNIITTTPNATEELSNYIDEHHPQTLVLCGQYDFTGALADYTLTIEDPVLFISVWERQ